MQPSTKPTVPTTPSVPVQNPVGHATGKQPAPIPLSADWLQRVAGGTAPNTNW